MARLLTSLLALSLVAPVALTSCTSEPADAKSSSPAGMSARDRQLGAQEHPKLLAEFGGPYTGPGNAMVQRVGKAMAVKSGLSATGSDCTVTLLNTTVVNAFAIPGCYVYVTRGLLSIMNDEAELASVLGHEIGHVAARHSQKRQNTAMGAGIISILGAVLTGSDAIGQLLGQGAQLYTLSYSRKQEYEADDLGIRYMTTGGYDPYAAADMLRSLDLQSTLDTKMRGQDESARIPSWARTHPLTAARVTRATQKAAATGVPKGQGKRDSAGYMTAIDGLLYGDDPEQGFIDEHKFAHPKLKIAFDAPDGYVLNNSTSAVTAQGPGQIQAQFSGGALQSGESLNGYVTRVFQALLGNSQQNAQFSQLRESTVNGLAAADVTARVPTQNGSVDATVVAYRIDPTTAYHFVFLTPSGVDASSVINKMAGSFRRLSDSEAAQLKPRVIDVVTVKQGDTVQSLAKRMAYSNFQVERFRTINDLAADAVLKPGQQVKIIVQGR